MGGCIRITHGPENEESFFPFNSDSFVSLPKLAELKNWISFIDSASKKEALTTSFTNLTYAGGHKGYPEGKRGKIIISPTTFTFHEIKGVRNESLGAFKFDIPIDKIREISIKKTSEVSRMMSVMAGPMWGVGMPTKKTFVLVEYTDKYGIEQKPLFDFVIGDFGDKMKRRLINAVYEQMKNKPKTQEQKTGEDPLKILKLRYAKGELSKDDFEEMKKTLEED